jgi:hypothetical protein
MQLERKYNTHVPATDATSSCIKCVLGGENQLLLDLDRFLYNSTLGILSCLTLREVQDGAPFYLYFAMSKSNIESCHLQAEHIACTLQTPPSAILGRAGYIGALEDVEGVA